MAKCYDINPKVFLHPQSFMKDIPEAFSVNELKNMTNDQLETLANTLGLPVDKVSKKTGRDGEGGPRHEQLVALVNEYQWAYRTSVESKANEVIKMNKLVTRVIASQKPELEKLKSEIGIVREEINYGTAGWNQRPTQPASEETIRKFASALQELRVETRQEGRRVKKQQSKIEAELKNDIQNLARASQNPAQNRELITTLQERISAKKRYYFTDVVRQRLTEQEMLDLQNHLLTHPMTNHIEEDADPQVPLMRVAGASTVLDQIINNGYLPYNSDIEFFQRVFGDEVADALRDSRNSLGINWETVQEIYSIPRVMVTMLDLSATARQGLAGLIAHPQQSAKSTWFQLQAFASEESATAKEKVWLKSEKLQRGINDFKLYWAPLDSVLARSSEREETFISQIQSKLINSSYHGWGKMLWPAKWVFGHPARASERAWITYLNSQRKWMWEGIVKNLEEEGYSMDRDPKVFEDAAKFINAATGRGNGRMLSNSILNATFFSPRFVASRFEHLFRSVGHMLGPNQPATMRAEAFRQFMGMASFWGFMALMAGFAAHSFGWEDEEEGVKVGMNPFDSDFLKMQVGKTRIDIGGGYGQIIRTMTRIASGLPPFGGISEGPLKWDDKLDRLVRAEGVSDPESFWRTVTRDMLKFKLNPPLSALVQMGDGRTVAVGEKVTPSTIVEQLMFPISFQEIPAMVQEHEFTGLSLLVPEMFGFGTTVYADEPKATLFGGGKYLDTAIGEAMFDDPNVYDR